MVKLLGVRLPLVELFPNPALNTPLVRPDEEAIARLAARHFLDRGFRSFAFFWTDQGHWALWRRQAFERVLQGFGYHCHAFSSVRERSPAGKEPRPIDDRHVIRWLRGLPKPCGVFCATDIDAMQLTRSCRTDGILVPEQIAVLGVDNDLVICGVCFPRLSSIELGSARIGYEAAALLDRMMAGQKPPHEGVCVEPLHVVTRQLTDTSAIEDPDIAQAARLIREQACRRVTRRSGGQGSRIIAPRVRTAVPRCFTPHSERRDRSGANGTSEDVAVRERYGGGVDRQGKRFQVAGLLLSRLSSADWFDPQSLSETTSPLRWQPSVTLTQKVKSFARICAHLFQ